MMPESATGSTQRLCVMELRKAGKAGGQGSGTSPSLNKDPAGHDSPLSELYIFVCVVDWQIRGKGMSL